MRPRINIRSRLLVKLAQNEQWLIDQENAYPEQLADGLTRPCVAGPRQFKLDGNPVPTLHAVYSEILGIPFSRSWRTERMCPTPHCCVPGHHRLKIQLRTDGTPVDPIPTAKNELSDEDIIDLIGLIGPDTPIAILSERLDTPVMTLERVLREHF